MNKYMIYNTLLYIVSFLEFYKYSVSIIYIYNINCYFINNINKCKR